MLAVLSTLLAFSLSPSSINLGPVHPGSSSEIQVRYLGANGWAVTVGQKILIFDYQERTDPDPPSPAQRDLAHGYIDPEELSGLEVYVFVTHSHFDHFDPVIYQWANALDRIHYVFGWKAGDRPTHHYVEERRAQVKIGDVEIYTICSHANDVPEVAYLVRVNDLVIYHNGDYRAAYEEDYRYLRTITDHIDVAFLIGHPFPDHQHFRQAMRLSELFRIGTIFPMNREGEPQRCRDYARLLAERGATAAIHVAGRRGEVFTLAP